jgi:hypothetical protein
MSDKFNNHVRTGTVAVFTTEYGTVDPTCEIGERNGARVDDGTAPGRGTCSVLWTSQAPRFPTFNRDLLQTTAEDDAYSCGSHNGRSGPCPNDLGTIRGLRSTVLVTAEGEETFVDANGSGLYDEGETFENLPEAFVDHNEDQVFTPVVGPDCPPPSGTASCEAAGFEEEFIDKNGDNQYSLNVDPNTGSGVYNGSLCPVSGDGIYCSRDLVNVRDEVVLTLASPPSFLQTLLVQNSQVTDELRRGADAIIYISDEFNNQPGAGTTITVEADEDCELAIPTGAVTVPDRGGRVGAFGVEVALDPNNPGGTFQVFASDDASSNQFIGSFDCVREATGGGFSPGG